MISDDSWEKHCLHQPHPFKWVNLCTYLLPYVSKFIILLTLRLVLCYDCYRLPCSLECSCSLLVGSTSKINAIHLQKECKQQIWVVWHKTERPRFLFKHLMLAQMQKWRYKLRNAERILWLHMRICTNMAHTGVPISIIPLSFLLSDHLFWGFLLYWVNFWWPPNEFFF